MPFLTDHAAKEIALTRWVLPECLHVPVAAIDEAAIAAYIGDIAGVLSGRGPGRAFLVRARKPAPADPQLPIWGVPGSAILHQPHQVWVHIAYGRYRSAYRRAFPAEDITGKIMSHTMNRRVAALAGFQYVRIVPISRSSNSSSGALSERWGVELHRTLAQQVANRRRGAFIRYADLCGLMLMLDMRIGGGVMQAVNDAQALVRPRC